MRLKLMIPLFLLAALWMAGCNLVSTPCAWVNAEGDSTALQQHLQAALDKANISGTIKTKSYGESGGERCSYHEKAVSAEVTINVADTGDLPALTDLAARIETILQSASSTTGNKASLTHSDSIVIFKPTTGGTTACIWQFNNNTCRE